MLIVVDDSGPDGEFLRGIEQQSSAGIAFVPCAAGEALPIKNFRRGPRVEVFGPTLTVEIRLEGTCSAIAGRDHNSTFAQPCVETGPWLSAHTCVIRRSPGRERCGKRGVVQVLEVLRRRSFGL